MTTYGAISKTIQGIFLQVGSNDMKEQALIFAQEAVVILGRAPVAAKRATAGFVEFYVKSEYIPAPYLESEVGWFTSNNMYTVS